MLSLLMLNQTDVEITQLTLTAARLPRICPCVIIFIFTAVDSTTNKTESTQRSDFVAYKIKNFQTQ